MRKRLVSKGFIPLGNFIESWKRGDGPRDGFYTEDKSHGVYFIRVNNLKEHSIDLTDVKLINRSIHEGKLKRAQVTSGDVVFAISGTKDNLGTVSIVPEHIKEANLNSALVRFDLNPKLDKRFFCLLFDLGFIRTQIAFTGKGAAQNNLNNKEIYSILVPNLVLLEQQRLVELYKTAKTQQKQKEQQAQELLAGIDEYLLSELGIMLPAQDNSLEKRIFKIQFNTVSGQRIDPIFYSTLSSRLFFSKYDYCKLGEVAHYFKSGFGVGRQDQVEEEHGVIQIRPTNISSLGKLIFTKNVYVSPESLAEKDFLNYGDVLFNNTNSQELVGKTSFFEIADKKLTYSNHITVIKVNQKNLNAIYLQNVLNLYQRNKYFYSICTNWNNLSGVGNELLKNVKIPLPPLNKQEEIVEHIQTIRNKAQQLQSESAQILADAKAKVERMILGDSGGEPCQHAG